MTASIDASNFVRRCLKRLLSMERIKPIGGFYARLGTVVTSDREKKVKTAGIIGGTGPESTVEYYRRIIAAYREARADGSYPPIIINSINMTKLVDSFAANRLGDAADYLVEEIRRLAAAGADFAFVAANTPHIVFDDLRRRSPLPLISIVEATCAEAKARGLKKLGLMGTRFTMQASFYPEVFSRQGIALVVPDPREHASIHDIYMNELVPAIFSADTRKRLLKYVDQMKERDEIDGLILGGTELSLIFREETVRGIPVLDTTQIHVNAVVAELLG
jgi:aspartate racemase